MKKSILHEAMRIVQSKKHTHTELFLHFTFIVQNNKIVEWGRNHVGAPAKHMGYHNRFVDETYSPKTHSELDAYRKGRGLIVNSKPFEIVNIRVNRSGVMRQSKPCSCCYTILKE